MALYLLKELDNTAKVAVWQITETEAELRELSSTPADEMEEISFIKSESLRKQRLAVRALLNELFDDKVYLAHHDNGKPYIENNSINISITHTEKYVAVILDQNDEVGIDIESLDRDFSVVEKKALSEDEIDDLVEDGAESRVAVPNGGVYDIRIKDGELEFTPVKASPLGVYTYAADTWKSVVAVSREGSLILYSPLWPTSRNIADPVLFVSFRDACVFGKHLYVAMNPLASGSKPFLSRDGKFLFGLDVNGFITEVSVVAE